MADYITSFIRENIRYKAEPPRQIRYLDTLRFVFEEASSKFIFFLGLSGTFIVLITTQNAKPTNHIFFLFLALLPLLISALPFYSAYRVTKAIRIGRILVAKIETVEFSQDSRNTLDALENGLASGTWRLPDGQLINFQVDEAWAKELKVGSDVELLVTSANFRGIFPLGLHK
jgi:hypothetical protein